jgi:hypothetical protein
MNFNLKEWEAEVTRATIHMAMWEIAAFIVFFLVLYVVVKAAVRDGINEANKANRWAKSVTSEEAMKDMPDMRAER